MRRRAFLRAMLGAGAAMVGAHGAPARAAMGAARAPEGTRVGVLIPMDREQTEPLRAYGIVYRALSRGGRAEWLLDYRGGAFLIEEPAALDDALEKGVWTTDPAAEVEAIEAARAAGSTIPMPLEVAPEIAVYAPPYAAPWDDAVRLALEYAGIPYRIVWDREILGGGLEEIDWLHLHHEDFTGQYGKYGPSVRATEWYRRSVALDRSTAAEMGFDDVPSLKRAVATSIREYVETGGFLFAMCAATETLDLALAGRPPSFEETLAFRDFQRETAPVGPFSNIDGHRVNTPDRLPLDTVEIAPFAPAVDPVASMLTQNHSGRMPDWYGLTTSFRPEVLQPSTVALATCRNGALAKYVHGDRGRGTFTFLGGHDPEDPRHAVGDPPTDLSDRPRSPGYRLILNNVLFPAAEQEERRT